MEPQASTIVWVKQKMYTSDQHLEKQNEKKQDEIRLMEDAKAKKKKYR